MKKESCLGVKAGLRGSILVLKMPR